MVNNHDSHQAWLHDIEYRRAFGAENAKLEVATALADAREVVGATQATLAERAGVSQAYIAKLESGEANPTVGQVGRLFACIWSRPVITTEPLVPQMSRESSVIESMSEGRFTIFNEDAADHYGSSSIEGSEHIIVHVDRGSNALWMLNG